MKDKFFNALHRTFCVGAMVVMLTPPLSMADSVMFQANLGRTGVYDDVGPEEPPKLVWKFDTGSPVISTPLVYDEFVYTSDFEGGVHVLNRNNGHIKWGHELGGRSSFQIALSEGSLLVGRHPLREDSESYLISMNAGSGEELWKFRDSKLSAIDSPTAYGENVFLTSMHDYIYSLKFDNGEEQWRFPIQGGTRQPLVSGDVLYFQDNKQTIYAISIDSGNLLWSYVERSDMDSSFSTPAIGEDCIYAMILGEESGTLVALDKYDGELRKEFPIEFKSSSSISLADGIAFFGDDGEGHAGAHGYMNAMDVESGELIWRFETGGFVRGAASIAGDTVYFGSGDNYMYAVDRHTGEMKWRYETDAGITSTPAVVDGRLYFGSIDGHVYVLE